MRVGELWRNIKINQVAKIVGIKYGTVFPGEWGAKFEYEDYLVRFQYVKQAELRETVMCECPRTQFLESFARVKNGKCKTNKAGSSMGR